MSKKVGLPDFVKFKYDNHFVDEISNRTRTEIIRNIPVEKIITNVMQPRKDMGNLNELAESIKEKGIIEPVLVRPKEGKFEIIAGERRYKAAKLAGLKEIPCIEYDIADNEALEVSIIENIQRKDLNIFESAHSLKSLSEIYGYTHHDISKKIGRSRVTVSELVRITDIPTDIEKRCIDLKINSKTFLLELAKLGTKEKMNVVLDEYTKKPFSRDKLKQERNKEDSNVGKKKVDTFKFNITSEDKSVKINFNLKDKNFNKNDLIAILEKIIMNIKNDSFKELKNYFKL